MVIYNEEKSRGNMQSFLSFYYSC